MMTARRAAKGPYSNTGPLSHFDTHPDLFPHAPTGPKPEPVVVSPLVFLPVEPIGKSLAAMWAGCPLFREQPSLDSDDAQDFDAWDRWLANAISWNEYVAIVQQREQRNARQ